MSKVALVSQKTVLLLLEMAAHFSFIFQINFGLTLIKILIILWVLGHLHLRMFDLLLSQHHLMARKLHLAVELSSELGLHVHRLLHHHIRKLSLSHRPLSITVKRHLGHHTCQ